MFDNFTQKHVDSLVSVFKTEENMLNVDKQQREIKPFNDFNYKAIIILY